MTTLVAASQDARALEELLEEAQGELTPELEAWLAEMDKNLATKADSYRFIMARLEANAEALKKQAAELSAAARALEGVEEKMRERIRLAMHTMGTKEIRGTSFRFKLSPSTPRLVIEDENKLPDDYVVVAYKPNNEKIKADLKDKKTVPGCRLEETESLRIYVNKEQVK